MKNNNYSGLSFLSPALTIKNSHLNKTDIKNIKYSLLHKICFTSIVTAVLVLLINLISLFSMGFDTNWNQIEVYGLPSLLGQIISIAGSSCVIVLAFISLKSKIPAIKNNLAHLANLLVFVVMIAYLFLSFYADVSQGFLSDSPTLSPSVALISFFLVVQPVFWVEAMVLDGILSIGLVTLALIFHSQQTMQAQSLMYYFFIAAFFPVISYVIVSILFYAETQRYCEELRNGALYNSATYDALTACKNRHALKEALSENGSVWEYNKDSILLVMMFDIDDFKLYNDQFSHIGGDFCLKAIADSVRKAFPSPALDFYRFGGEEFLLFLEVKDKKEAKEMMEKTRLAVSDLYLEAAKGAPCKNVTISIGGTLANVNEVNDFNEIIKIADQNLYKAKGSGKNVSVLDDKIIVQKQNR